MKEFLFTLLFMIVASITLAFLVSGMLAAIKFFMGYLML